MRSLAQTATLVLASLFVASPALAADPSPAPASAPAEVPPETPPMEPIKYEPPHTDPQPRAESEPIPGAQPGSLLNRFSGSYVDWWSQASVEYFGLGSSYASAQDFAVAMGGRLSPAFFAYREGRHQLAIRTSLGWSVELTNSSTTTQLHEFELHDLPLWASDTISLFAWGGKSDERPGPAAAYNPALEGGGENNTWLVPSAGLVFPTSKSSQLSSYLATSLGLGIKQRFKLLGGASPGLPSVTLSLSESYRHDFHKTNVPVGSTPTRAQPAGVIVSDQLSKWLLVTDRLQTTAGATLPLYKGLELSLGFSYLLTFKPKPTTGCVQTPTGCVNPEPLPTGGATELAYTDLDIALSYRPIPELVLGLGYETFRSTADRATGQSNFLYTTAGSTFYLDVAFFPVEIGKRFQKPAPPPEPPLD